MAKTFEAHCARIKHVFGEKNFWRLGLLHSDKAPYKGEPVERLRLLNGNHTHKACVEWIVADLDTYRKRESVTVVRGSGSLADEQLVIAWLFWGMICAIDHNQRLGLFAAGYEVNTPEDCAEAWQGVVFVDFHRGSRNVLVSAHDRKHCSFDFSVPALRE